MTRIRFRSALRAIAVTGLVVALSGCGVGGDLAGGKKSPAAAKDKSGKGVFKDGTTMKNIQNRGKLIVGVNFGLAPFAYKNSVTGSPEGFDVEMVKWIATGIFGSNIENKITWVELSPFDRELALEQDRVDIVVGRYDVTAARKRFVDFAGPYYISHQALIVANLDDSRSRGVTSLLQLNGRKVCTVRGSANVDAILGVLPAANVSVTGNTVADCGVQLFNGNVQGILADSVDATPWLQAAGSDAKVISATYGALPYGVGLRLDRDDMREYLNTQLDAWKDWNVAKDQFLRGVPGDLGQPEVDRY
jgi:ABC-type amino acid transport substrate-binding protein